MAYKFVFKRVEKKFIITKRQKEEILGESLSHLEEDEYCRFKVNNVYFDTLDYLIARRSIEKPVYKEKLRIRSYGDLSKDELVFLEIKRKYDSVVYKRRINLTCKDAFNMVLNGSFSKNGNQIEEEIRYFCFRYINLRPSMALFYNREAYFDKQDMNLRITFDNDIQWQKYDLYNNNNLILNSMIDDDYLLMEIKTSNVVPLWLSNILNINRVYSTSFSKYGNAYKSIIKKGDVRYAG